MNTKSASGTDDDDDLWPIIEADLEREGEFAIRESVTVGVPVYFWESAPDDMAIKQYPGGRGELVRSNRAGDQVVRQLA